MVTVSYFVTKRGYVIEATDGFDLVVDRRVNDSRTERRLVEIVARQDAAEIAVDCGLAPTDIIYDHEGAITEDDLFAES